MSSDDILARLSHVVSGADIVERLREYASVVQRDYYDDGDLPKQAAEVIMDLRAEVERLRTAGEWLAIVALGVRPWITPLAAMVERERIDEALAAWNEARRER